MQASTPPDSLKHPLREQLRRVWARLRGGELTPARAAAAVALGVFVGTLPTPMLHVWIVLAVCVPLRLDAPVTYLAANISVPPLGALIWYAGVQLGERILHGRFVPLSRSAMHEVLRHPGPLFGSLLLGSVILGVVLACVFSLVTYGVLRARTRRGRDDAHGPQGAYDTAVARTAARYDRAGTRRATYHYVRGKLRSDPSARSIAALGPLGEVLDLGCGRGQLGVVLLECGAATRVRGLDWDDSKVAAARAAAEGLAAEFAAGDVRASEGAKADTVLLVDVLHYFDRATQDALLATAAGCVREGGRLVIREADRARGWRSWLTRLEEGVFTALRFNRGEGVCFTDVQRELVPRLEALGFRCEVTPCWGATPFSNVLVVARKPSAATPAPSAPGAP